MYKGIFWKNGNGLAAVKVKCGRDGAGLDTDGLTVTVRPDNSEHYEYLKGNE